jgi:hypothetical protein
MLSTLNLIYDINEDTGCELLQRITMPAPGSKVKVYIPRLMQNIEKGTEPIEYPCPNQYAGAFINDAACRPSISGTIKEKNYLVGVIDNNASVTAEAVTAYDKYGKITTQIVPMGELMRCSFLNGKLTQLRINSSDSLKGTFGEADQEHKWKSYDGYANPTPDGSSSGNLSMSTGTKYTPSQVKSMVDKYERAYKSGADESELKSMKKKIKAAMNE